MNASSRHRAQSWFRSRGGRRFGLEFALIVLVKIALLLVIYFLFFAPHPRPDTSPAAVEGHLLSAAPERAGYASPIAPVPVAEVRDD